jgi:hypothetical protein
MHLDINCHHFYGVVDAYYISVQNLTYIATPPRNEKI